MIVDDILFKLRSDLIIHVAQEAPERFLLEDPESGRAFIFKKREFIIITLLDGMSSLKTIARMASLEVGSALSISLVSKFVERLSQLGLLEQDGREAQTGSVLPSRKIDYIELQFERWKPLLRALARIFFSPFSGYGLFALAMVVSVIELFFWHYTFVMEVQRYFSWPALPLTLVLIYVCLPIILFIHELGHLLAALYFLQRLYPIRIYKPLRAYVSPSPSAIWGLQRRAPRIVIALAGLYFQTLLLLFVWAIWGYLGQYFVIGLICTAFSIPLISSFFLGVVPVYPGLPERKTDGYYAMSYLLNMPNLAARAQTYLAWSKDRTRKPPVWLPQLTRFQLMGLISFISALPWLSLALIAAVFCCASLWVFWPIHSSGVVVIIIIAFWLIWPYFSFLREKNILWLKRFRQRQS